jgi:hypothetical protein
MVLIWLSVSREQIDGSTVAVKVAAAGAAFNLCWDVPGVSYDMVSASSTWDHASTALLPPPLHPPPTCPTPVNAFYVTQSIHKETRHAGVLRRWVAYVPIALGWEYSYPAHMIITAAILPDYIFFVGRYKPIISKINTQHRLCTIKKICSYILL